jgi:hypothetical protein
MGTSMLRSLTLMRPMKKATEPSWMPVIVASGEGGKRLRRIEYRVVRAPTKVGRVQLGPPKRLGG